MAPGDTVVVNLSSGPERPEQVTVAFVVADSAVSSGKRVALFLTSEAVRLALEGTAEGIAVDGYQPLGKLFRQVAEGGGELFCCPPCFRSRGLDEDDLASNAKVSGAMSLFEWVGPEGAMVFSF